MCAICKKKVKKMCRKSEKAIAIFPPVWHNVSNGKKFTNLPCAFVTLLQMEQKSEGV